MLRSSILLPLALLLLLSTLLVAGQWPPSSRVRVRRYSNSTGELSKARTVRIDTIQPGDFISSLDHAGQPMWDEVLHVERTAPEQMRTITYVDPREPCTGRIHHEPDCLRSFNVSETQYLYYYTQHTGTIGFIEDPLLPALSVLADIQPARNLHPLSPSLIDPVIGMKIYVTVTDKSVEKHDRKLDQITKLVGNEPSLSPPESGVILHTAANAFLVSNVLSASVTNRTIDAYNWFYWSVRERWIRRDRAEMIKLYVLKAYRFYQLNWEKVWIAAGISLVVSALLLRLICLVCCCRKKKRASVEIGKKAQ